MILLTASFLFLSLNRVWAEFNSHFSDFIEENYGVRFLDTLQRTDLGESGSFGGKDAEDDKIEKDPVIFIHGVSDIAGGKMQSLAAKFRKKGYKNGELYATSYADGSKNNPLSWADYSMKCEHVKQIRTFILAVRYYTLRDVDVIAYSLGVPIARKAILGGTCVDTKEDLGSPLTSYIDTFIGIAGPNHGIALQIAGISIPGCVIGAIPILPICSKVVGLYSGLCPTESQFLTDINESEHYEGRFVFSILSKTDNWIGYEVCGQITAKIPGEDSQKTFKMYNHDEILEKTCVTQIQMIENHSAVDDIETQRDNSTIAHRRKIRNREKLDRRTRSSTSKSTRNSGSNPFLDEETYVEDVDETRYGRKSRKISLEDYDYLSDKYDHPTLPSLVSSSDKTQIQIAEKYSGKQSQKVETMRMSDGPRKQSHNGFHTQGNVISDRERAEGTYGNLRQWERLPKNQDPATENPSRTKPTITNPLYTNWRTTTTSQPTTTTTTTVATASTSTHSITTFQNIPSPAGNLQSPSSKTNGYFPHPYDNNKNTEATYHTKVKIAYD